MTDQVANRITLYLNCSKVVMSGNVGAPSRSNRSRISIGWVCLIFTAMGVLSPSSVLAQGFVEQMDALKGLEGVYIMGGDLDDELTFTGLQKGDVLSAVTIGLRMAGMPVLDESEWLLLEDSPVLHISIVSSVDHEASSLYMIRLEVFFLMNKLSDPDFTSYAVAWGEGKVGVIDSAAADVILRDLDALVKRLASDFHAANS